MKLTPTEAQHIETLRRLTERRFNAVLTFTESLAPTAEEPEEQKAPALCLVVSNDSPIPLTDRRIAQMRARLKRGRKS